MTKSYKEEVVDQAILGLKQGGLSDPEAFRLVFERIYDCGYYECRRDDILQTQKFFNREQVITEMCYTWRHDYGLIKDTETDISSGMTVSDREFLWKQMAQLFDNCISKLLK